jgi:hypothetical protein
MVFVFGTMDREQTRGYMVDRCPSCLDLEWFELVDHRQVWHAYFLPLGRGKLVYASRRCEACRSEFPLERDVSVCALSRTERADLDLDAGLSRTNPELAARFAAIDSLRGAEHDAYRDPHDETAQKLLEEAVGRLRELERRGVDTARYLPRFEQWGRLAASERELLAAELKGFHAATTG